MHYSRNRRRALVALAFSGALLTSFASHAQTASGRIIVIVAPGGSADALARMVADKAGERLKTNFVVENKPGAGGNIASQTVARSAPDGSTFLVTANNHTVNPSLFKDAGYGIDDLVPVAQLMQGPSVIVVPANSKYLSLKDMLDDAKANPGTVAYGSAGVGTPSHIAGEMLATAAKVKLNHVPYRGSGLSLNDVAGGQIPVVISSLVAAMPLVKAGKVRALAVTSKDRWAVTPDIPAASESGLPGYEHITWLGLFAPKGTAPERVAEVNKATREALAEPEMTERVK
ncbi:MAG TPA: tripartite tricarboxylate transporter substrate-binding protein, partial [Burkholderiaceae bacterium]|nr:tripartite tricarboxylate transporter substrate-binding protein [Burkholderiaceae bacterium]